MGCPLRSERKRKWSSFVHSMFPLGAGDGDGAAKKIFLFF